jgi:ABC-type multidrug transport system fused ATPase/permease subunit
LKDVNFTANFGQNCHRWSSGTGKSTIASLLRFDIDSGEILIDGKIFMISIRESSAI